MNIFACATNQEYCTDNSQRGWYLTSTAFLGFFEMIEVFGGGESNLKLCISSDFF